MYSAVVGFSSIAICVQSVISSVLRTPIIEAWEQLHAVISSVVDVCNAALTMRRSSILNVLGDECEYMIHLHGKRKNMCTLYGGRVWGKG